jgi:hypothetical protein
MWNFPPLPNGYLADQVSPCFYCTREHTICSSSENMEFGPYSATLSLSPRLFLLAYFLYLEKNKIGILDYHAVYVSLYLPY